MSLTNTLVEQLRNPELSDTYKDLNWEIMGEAADEIERLRAELETVTAARDRWHRKYEGACATIETWMDAPDEPSVPWKCDWPGCTLKGWHGHAGLPPDYK